MASVWQAIVAFCEWICGPLVPIGTAIKELFLSVPMWVPGVALSLLFAILSIWSLRLSKAYVMEGAPYSTWWNDPRRWAAVVLIVLIVLYLAL